MNDREALEKARQRGRQRIDSVRYLYRRYAPRFLAYFLKHRLTRRDAEALVQDVFVAIVRHCDDFFGETRSDAWLWGIARNTLLDYFRRQRPEEIADHHALELLVSGDAAPPAAQAPITGAASAADCARVAYAAFAAAYADRAEMLARVAFDGWTIEDLAAALKRTPDATRAYLAQCREKLSPYLEPCREIPAA